MIITMLGPDPEGKERYTRYEAHELGLCDNCIHWQGKKKEFSCKAVVPPPTLCARFK